MDPTQEGLDFDIMERAGAKSSTGSCHRNKRAILLYSSVEIVLSDIA